MVLSPAVSFARRIWLGSVLSFSLVAAFASAQTSAPASQPTTGKATTTATSQAASSKAKAPIGVEFDFDRAITEQAMQDDFLAALSNQEDGTSLREWLRRLNAAAESDHVSAVLLMLDNPKISWPHLQELRPAIEKIKKAGKPVIAYSDDLTTRTQFLLAATADTVYVSPAGGVFLSGIMSEEMYFKTLMDKLGLAGDFVHVGAYKGATEPFTLTGPTHEAQEMTDWLMDNLYAQLCREVGQARGKDVAAGKAWIDGGPYTASQALQAGLIDGFKTRLEVIAEVKKLAGLKPTDKLNRRYSDKKKSDIDFGNPFAFFKIFAEAAAKKDTGTKPTVGLIYVEGLIIEGESQDDGLMGKTIGSTSLLSAIEKARKDVNVKAVVLRIDSPGGSATASDIVHAALLNLKAEKPLVVSVGRLAASGGYYMAVAGERIYVYPDSLVGSIGVWGGKVVMKGLFDWIGINTHRTVRGGPNTTMFDITTPFNESERKWVTQAMTEAYTLFTRAVKNGRGNKLKDFEEKLAGGRIFTGEQGVANGLADEIGTLETALAYAAKKGGLKKGEYEVRVIPRSMNFIEKLVEKMGEKRLDDEVSSEVSAPRLPVEQGLGQMGVWLEQLRTFHPGLAEAVGRQLRVLLMLRKGQVLMLPGFELVIER